MKTINTTDLGVDCECASFVLAPNGGRDGRFLGQLFYSPKSSNDGVSVVYNVYANTDCSKCNGTGKMSRLYKPVAERDRLMKDPHWRNYLGHPRTSIERYIRSCEFTEDFKEFLKAELRVREGVLGS